MFSNIVYKYFEVKKVLNLILDQDWIDNLEPNSSNILAKPLKLFSRKYIVYYGWQRKIDQQIWFLW